MRPSKRTYSSVRTYVRKRTNVHVEHCHCGMLKKLKFGIVQEYGTEFAYVAICVGEGAALISPRVITNCGQFGANWGPEVVFLFAAIFAPSHGAPARPNGLKLLNATIAPR